MTLTTQQAEAVRQIMLEIEQLLESALSAASSRVTALEEALRVYGQHTSACESRYEPWPIEGGGVHMYPCTCGFASALSSTEAVKESGHV